MKTENNLFSRVAAFGNLMRAFVQASRGKRDQPEVQRFEYHLEERLWEIKRELEAEAYHWGGYRSFWIHDPKKRLIRAAPFRDRVVHHALNDVLAPVIERGYIADTYACLAGRGSLAAVRRYEEYLRRQGGRGYVLKADVRHYFPSVDHAVLRGLLRRKIGDDQLLRLLDGLIGSGDDGGGKGIPIGNLTSQLFANLYLDPLDHYVKENLRQRSYLRYMDDVIVLAAEKSELWDVLQAVQGFLRERLRLSLQPQRLSVTPVAAGVDVLGYVVYPNGSKRVRRRNVVNFRRRLTRLETGHGQGEIPFFHARQSIASWLGLAQHASTFRLSRSLFLQHDVRNVGKRLLLSGRCPRAGARGRRAREHRFLPTLGSGAWPSYNIGMATTTIEQALREFFAAQTDGIIAAYLFGSVARGTAGARSDVDVAILYAVAPPATLEGLPLDLERRIGQLVGRPVQVVVLNTAPVRLLHRVLRDGVLVLDSAKSARIRFEVRARNEFFDLQPIVARYRRWPLRSP